MKRASLVGAFFISAILCLPAAALCRADGQLAQADVARVLDGDTLRLADGRSVRLIGINAPELGRKGHRDEPFSVMARDRLKAMVDANGGKVGLRLGRQAQDHYGRLLAHAYDAGGENLEADLLAEGLGYFLAISPNTRLAECHRAAEQQARHAGKGLWFRSPAISSTEIRRAGFALVRARVQRLERNRGGIWLELPGSLVIQVPHRSSAAFGSAALEKLMGREIEVRGWVIDRRGRVDEKRQARWMLKVTHSSMLQRLE